jgi:phenylpyruvate C(3)-methyltransferase
MMKLENEKNIHCSSSIFNLAIAAYAISSACDLEIIDELKHKNVINIQSFCFSKNLHQQTVKAIISTLCCFDICQSTSDENIFQQGSLFAEIYHTKGCFLWLIRGYGSTLQNLASIAHNQNRTGSFIQADGKYIAIASADQGSRFVDPYFEKVLHSYPFAIVADIGCGNAQRLVQLAKQNPEVHGVGVDINQNAVFLAHSRIAEEGLSERIKILQGDMRYLEERPEFANVDTLFSFFCGHDFWHQSSCLEVMQNLRSVFPNAKRFLLCDTYRSNIVPSSNIPIFTLGFETVHAVMGQYIPSLEEWMNLFAESSWKCVYRHEVEAPFTTIFDLRPV